MKKIAIIFIVFSSLVFSQKEKYVDRHAVDGPGFTSGSQVLEKSYLPSILNKNRDPSITGGRISDVTKYFALENNVDATSIPLFTPIDMAEDANGNLYISSSDFHAIRRVDTNGKITTFAGTGEAAWSGDGDTATKAKLNSPHGLAFDASGNLYISDRDNHVIRKIDTNGVITTVAGKGGDNGFSGDGGAATSAQLSQPYDVAFDAAGNLYISEYRRIRKVDTSGNISLFAGDGDGDFSGDGAAATSAGLGNPAHMVLDQSGNLYFADYTHHVVRKIDTNGVITSVYGVGGNSGNSSDNPKRLNTPFGVAYERVKIDATSEDEDLLYIIDYHNHVIIQVTLRGKQAGEPQSGNAYVEAEILWGKEGVAGFDGDGDTNWDETARFNQIETMITNFSATATGLKAVYHILDIQNNRIRKIVEEEVFADNTESSSMSTVAGADVYNGTNIAANTARLYIPRNSAFDKDGNYYVADQGNHMIRKIDTNGVITTVAGNGTNGFDGDGGAATSAEIKNPRGVTVDSKGNLYISDTENHRIRKVDTSGNISTLAGNGNAAYSGDGAASTSSEINFPYQITVDASDNIYFAENGNHVIRKIDVNGNISTVAGNNDGGYSGDGGQATNAQLAGPLGVAFDADGNLYIGDSGNHVIRKVDPNGIISTLAGTAQESGFVDGVTGTQARFYTPSTLAIDSKGNLYVTDSSNQRVRKITPDGAVSTIAGNGDRAYTADSVATTTSLSSPFGISIDQNDNIYLSDSWNYVVRKITPRKTTLKVPSEYTTIQNAIDYAVGGDTVLVAAGTYVENIKFKGKNISVVGTDKETTIIDGNKNGSVVEIINGSYAVLDNFTIQNGNGKYFDNAEGFGHAARVGGGIYNYQENTILKNLIVQSNTADDGGGIFTNGKMEIENCIIKGNINSNRGGGLKINNGNVIITNTVFDNNFSGTGGAIRHYGENLDIINCTFISNSVESTGEGGGAIHMESSPRTLHLINSIFWNNDKPSINAYPNADIDIYIENSTLQNGQTSVDIGTNGTLYWGSGNIDVNPMFVDTANGNYHLADWSPAIGAGAETISIDGATYTIHATDIEGNLRPNPAGSNPDMGAYENEYGSPQNAPPVLTALSDVSVNEDESITITLEAINADSADNDAITFSASSEKSEVKLSMGSSSGKLDISADENWNGLSKISVEATDGTAFDYGNFTVTFLPVNDKPIIASIASDTTNEETAKSIQVTASDIDGDELSISATTSDNHVVPSVSGMTLTLTPVKDFVGNTLVTLIVNDGSLTDTVSYQFTVLNVNDSPVLSEIKDQRIAEDSEIMVKVVATDVDDTSLSITGNAGSAGISVAFSGNDLTLKPEANWNGSSVITVYASDGKDMDSTKFNLTVDPMQDTPYNFDWVSTASDSINITQSNLTDTYDLKWNTSNEVDGEIIDYLISASVGQFPAEMINETADTSMTITYQDIIDNWYPNLAMLPRATLKFSVSATDGIDTVNVTGDDRVLFVNRYEYLSTEGEGVPTVFALHENYPNPFNPTTTLRFDLPEISDITLTIYNMLGQKVRTFNMQSTPAGYHSITWDATNDLGAQVGAGVYLYQLQTKDFVKTRKMVLLK